MGSFELPIQSPTDCDTGIALSEHHALLLSLASPPDETRPRQPAIPSRSARRPAQTQTSSSALSEAIGAARGKTAPLSGRQSYLQLQQQQQQQQRRGVERRGSLTGGTRLRMRIASNAMPKSLLPVTERKSQEENKLDRRTARDAEKADIAPDGTSASREGRQFAVANVGNNGRIYLRPTVRPAHIRHPQPNFVFPMTPPGTAGLDMLMSDDKQIQQLQQPLQQQQLLTSPIPEQSSFLLDSSDWTPDDDASSRFIRKRYHANSAATRAGLGLGHRRAVSDSTLQDASIARESGLGGFHKIVITQPAEAKRAKTLEDINADYYASAPLLEVAIPTWKLGTPRFTLQGTPMLCGSSYAPTEDHRSSRRSYQFPTERFIRRGEGVPLPPGVRPFPAALADAAPPPLVPLPPLPLLSTSASSALPALPSPSAQHARMGSQLGSFATPEAYNASTAVEPSMFDTLTFKPACDDRSVVRFASVTGSITAATPPRLVAEITSPKFMDYDLVSDFFLTYRSFLNPNDLLRLLVARLRWAIARDDEVGTVVRVRTFVALRHWILNYFVDDFVVEYGLRVLFCTLLNSIVDEQSHPASGPRKTPLKILTELKKCWRRSCAQYWTGAEFDDTMGPGVPISPGGIAGHRNPALDPTFWEQVAAGDVRLSCQDGQFYVDYESEYAVDHEPDRQSLGISVMSEESIHRHDGHDGLDGQGRQMASGWGEPATPDYATHATSVSARRQASPTSVTSLDFVSCSFPTKSLRLVPPGVGLPPTAHPVDPTLMHNASADPVATTPRALVGKRVRPNQGSASMTHRRTNSLTDSLREMSANTEKLLSKNEELLVTLPYAGCLVRGAIFPPGQPYVDVLPPGSNGGRDTTLFSPNYLDPLSAMDPQKDRASAMSGQGMRKLLGSVRRALSTRGQTVSPTHGNFINISPLGPRGATTNRLPGTAIVPQARPPYNGVRPPVRIDLLGAKIAEDFKTAVREDASIGTSRCDDESGCDLPIQKQPRDKDNKDNTDLFTAAAASAAAEAMQAAYADAFPDGFVPVFDPRRDEDPRPSLDTAITTGSKSIMIFDGTFMPELPTMTGALPMMMDRHVEGNGAYATDPTPPTTPPGHAMGSPMAAMYPAAPSVSSTVMGPTLTAGAFVPFPPAMAFLGTTSQPNFFAANSSAVCSSEVLGQLADFGVPKAPTVPPPVLPHAPPSAQQTAVDLRDDMTEVFTKSMIDDLIADEVDDAEEAKEEAETTPRKISAPASPRAARLPPSAWRRGHARQLSSRSHGSGHSFGRNRFTSTSNVTAPRTILSFDVTSNSGLSVDDSSESPIPVPLRSLRRRPGGDLKTATNVGELKHRPLRRSRSVGSLTTFTESLRSSFMRSQEALGAAGFVDVASVASVASLASMASRDFSAYSQSEANGKSAKNEPFSVGMLADKKKPAHRMSLFSTHSSKPMMRPSFELEAKKLAQIPDDADDDGGVESALLKLEGRFEPKARRASLGLMPSQTRDSLVPAHHSGIFGFASREEKLEHRLRQIDINDLQPPPLTPISGSEPLSSPGYAYRGQSDDGRGSTVTSPAFSPPPDSRPAAVPRMLEDVQSFVTVEPEEGAETASYCSTPILQRGLTDDDRSRTGATDDQSNRSVLADYIQDGSRSSATTKKLAASHPSSYEMVQKTDSLQRIPPGETMPLSSFLEGRNDEDDQSDRASELSSEMSADEEEEEEDDYGRVVQRLGRSNTVVSRLPAHALGDPEVEPARPRQDSLPSQKHGRSARLMEDHEASVPMTLVQALNMPMPGQAKAAGMADAHDRRAWGRTHVFPATPETEVLEAAKTTSANTAAAATAKPNPSQARMFSVHLPFILAFESEVLAQQFTLIEKDALHEIDWKELIEMRWKDAENSNARSWVEFLRNTDARGVEVVIARFNIMVKWAISEVVLTENLEERVRCVIKFIHIAAHCRRYRNFATMSQIAMALASNEVARLALTWQMVPAADVQVLRELEALVSPTRNFFQLRAEMEAVDIDTAEAGCIPFVGIYTHDLVFNAQRPSEIASSPSTPPLINFERCRYAASIVKTLLRLVEASGLYEFQPIEGITERCLWMSALSDEAIRNQSERLE